MQSRPQHIIVERRDDYVRRQKRELKFNLKWGVPAALLICGWIIHGFERVAPPITYNGVILIVISFIWFGGALFLTLRK